jgi:MerR family transcriptional regulator/heat shock protein HspR
MSSQRQAAEFVRLDVAASLVHLPPARIRLYVRQGIVRPSRSEGRAILFGEAELARLRKIRRLTEDLGLNTAGVEIVLRLLEDMDRLRSALEDQPAPARRRRRDGNNSDRPRRTTWRST